MKVLLLSIFLVSCSLTHANIPQGHCSVKVCPSKGGNCFTTTVEENKGRTGVTLRNQVVYNENGKKDKVALKVKRVIKCNKKGRN